MHAKNSDPCLLPRVLLPAAVSCQRSCLPAACRLALPCTCLLPALHLLVASAAVLALHSWIVKQHSGGELTVVQHMQQELLLILQPIKSDSHLSG